MLTLLTQLAAEADASADSSDSQEAGFLPVNVLIIFSMLFIYVFAGSAVEHFQVSHHASLLL